MGAKYSGVSGVQHTLLLGAPEGADGPSNNCFSVSVVTKKTQGSFCPLTRFFPSSLADFFMAHTSWGSELLGEAGMPEDSNLAALAHSAVQPGFLAVTFPYLVCCSLGSPGPGLRLVTLSHAHTHI